MRAFVLPLVLLFTACGGAGSSSGSTASSGSSTSAGADGQPIQVALRMVSQRAGATQAVGDGDTLHSGDHVVLHVELDQPAHLYVAQFFADGTNGMLYSSAEEGGVAGPGEVRIPSSGSFQLDDAVGEENVYVVVSRQPLAQVDDTIAEAVDEVRRSAQAGDAPVAESESATEPATEPAPEPAPEPEPEPAPEPATEPEPEPAAEPAAEPAPRPRAHQAPPRFSSLQLRALVRVDEEGSRIHRGETDERGVGVFRFTFQHQP